MVLVNVRFLLDRDGAVTVTVPPDHVVAAKIKPAPRTLLPDSPPLPRAVAGWIALLGADAFAALGLDLEIDLRSMHWYARGSSDAEAHFCGVAAQNRDLDVVADHDTLTRFPRQHKHASAPRPDRSSCSNTDHTLILSLASLEGRKPVCFKRGER